MLTLSHASFREMDPLTFPNQSRVLSPPHRDKSHAFQLALDWLPSHASSPCLSGLATSARIVVPSRSISALKCFGNSLFGFGEGLTPTVSVSKFWEVHHHLEHHEESRNGKVSARCSLTTHSTADKANRFPHFRLRTSGRIYAIGDLHGDWNQTVKALQIAGLLSTDNSYQWIGGSSILVQLGDILDRGDEEMAIISFLSYLDSQARERGGAVIMLNGNHETMNVCEDFRYVTSGAFEENEVFVNYAKNDHAGDYDAAFKVWWQIWPNLRREMQASSKKSDFPWNPLQTQRRLSCRSFLFRPGGPVACQLAVNSTILFVNDTIFAHGGVLPHHVSYGLERINLEVCDWMRGHVSDSRPIDAQSGSSISSYSSSDSNSTNEKNGIFRMPRMPKGKDESMPRVPFVATRGYDSVVWSRLYSLETYATTQDYVKAYVNIQNTLASVQASRLVVGHTPQIKGANSEFEGKVWRIDVGMSSGVLNAHPQVLEIDGNKVRVIKSQSMMAKL